MTDSTLGRLVAASDRLAGLHRRLGRRVPAVERAEIAVRRAITVRVEAAALADPVIRAVVELLSDSGEPPR